MNKEEFIKEFNDWTKEEILSRAFEICCENIELKDKLEKRKRLRKNDIEVWDDDLEIRIKRKNKRLGTAVSRH